MPDCEPRQGRKAAALSRACHVPQVLRIAVDSATHLCAIRSLNNSESLMSYLVIARKWRPQQFEDVVGQRAVTRTLRNALASGRLAQAFVFAGPRGVGKTTTARILARALNCVKGPRRIHAANARRASRSPRAATWTSSRSTRPPTRRLTTSAKSSSSGLAIRPVRDRYKVFIIDEVHQLSSHSFNSLLKSIEEPPPHVVFMMATTELEKIPETVLSRSQVYEFRTISTKTIAEQLRRIVDAEGITAGDDALQLVARDAEGSMRDAQSKLDQILAFTGNTVSAEDVSTVLGLGRARSAARCRAGRGRRERGGGIRAHRARGGDGVRPAVRLPRAVARRQGSARALGGSVAHRRSRDCRRVRARSREGAGRPLLARGSAARLRRVDARSTQRSAPRPSPGITSRWRCCGGSICAS